VRTVEHDEKGESVEVDEPVAGSSRYEDRLAAAQGLRGTVDLDRPFSIEDGVDLVEVMRALTIRIGCDEDVDTDLEAVGFVDDLVASARSDEPLCGLSRVERSHRGAR
jgi:hypothetical protein